MPKLTRCAGISSFLILTGLLCAQTPGTGRVHIKAVETYSGTPLQKPVSIVVYDVAANPDEVQLNKSRLNRMRLRVSGNTDDEKTKAAQKVIDNFSNVLVKELQKTGIPVSRGSAGSEPPDGALAVQGEVMTIDQGNRARRMVIGLGAGASTVKMDIDCFLKAPSHNVVVTKFAAESKSSRKPGAAETMGAGAAPAVAGTVGGVTEINQGAEGDATRLAKAVAKQIKKSMAAQGWISGS